MRHEKVGRVGAGPRAGARRPAAGPRRVRAQVQALVLLLQGVVPGLVGDLRLYRLLRSVL